MLKTRIILVVVSAIVIWLIFLLPKAVVENEQELTKADSASSKTASAMPTTHASVPQALLQSIKNLRVQFAKSTDEKNAIFADSLQSLYRQASQFDSAAWFGEKAATFFNTTKSFLKAGTNFYDASTFAMDAQKQKALAEKARLWLGKVVEANPKNYEARIKVAMTYLSSGAPMQGIGQLRGVLAEDPKNELALFNMGMLSVQSGQNSKAIDWLKQLEEVNPNHIQGELLLGVAYANENRKNEAKAQFEKVKKMSSDPAVQSTVESYLNDLK
ncbi:MAG: peptidase [Bacteroidetes bacterium]|nr:peptidase [Bacteroidota bacterium]